MYTRFTEYPLLSRFLSPSQSAGTQPLSPAQLLEIFAEQVGEDRATRLAGEHHRAASLKARLAALTATIVEVSRLGMARMNARDAVRVANGESARPLALDNRTQDEYDALEDHSEEVFGAVNAELKAYGWRAVVGLGARFRHRHGYRYRNTILLYPL